MTERVPPPRKRRLAEEPAVGRLERVVRVTPIPVKPTSPLQDQGQSSQEATTNLSKEEPPKRRIVESAEKWKIPDSTSSMIDQICHTHRRLEQLLITFTTKASPKFIKKMDEEFQKIQVEAIRHYNQGIRLKEPLTATEDAVEKGLLHGEVKTLKQQLSTLNEDYEAQIEIEFDLQDKLTALEETLATLRSTHNDQRELIQQMTDTIQRQKENLEARDGDLALAQQQIAKLNLERQEQAQIAAATQEELRLLHMATNPSTPNTPRSRKMEAHESDSNAQAGTSALYSMIEEMTNPTAPQQQTIGNLRKELAYTRRERDELRVAVDRIMESPRSEDDGLLNPSDLPPNSLLPRTAIYHQLISHITPFTTIMQCYQALRGLNLLISKVPLLRSGITLTKPQFEQIWQNADATARDTLGFMWATGDLQLPTGVMEVVTASPPFYVGRFVLRTLSFIGHHHFAHTSQHPAQNKLPTWQTYPTPVFREIRDMVRSHALTSLQEKL